MLLKANNDDEKHGPYRQRLLECLGTEVKYVDKLPFRGFIFNPTSEENSYVILRSARTRQDKTYDSVLYHGRSDFQIISVLYLIAKEFITANKAFSPPVLQEVLPGELINKLKSGVHQYNKPGVTLELQKVSIESLYTVTKYVTGYKSVQVNKLYELYTEAYLKSFVPAKIIYHNGKETMVTPPVIESYGDKKIVIEGTTRVTYAYNNNITEIYAIVVKGVTDTLPSTGIFKLNQLLITDEEVEGNTRYVDFNHDNFRSIEKAIRNPAKTLI